MQSMGSLCRQVLASTQPSAKAFKKLKKCFNEKKRRTWNCTQKIENCNMLLLFLESNKETLIGRHCQWKTTRRSHLHTRGCSSDVMWTFKDPFLGLDHTLAVFFFSIEQAYFDSDTVSIVFNNIHWLPHQMLNIMYNNESVTLTGYIRHLT